MKEKMFEQKKNDFWKEKLVLMQRQNSRTGSPLQDISSVLHQIELINLAWPNLKSQVESSSSSVSWELFASEDFHIRAFFQRQTKISFMGRTQTGFEKIADAKLANDPFPVIAHFLRHFDEYQVELYRLEQKELRHNAKIKLACEFIKAFMNQKSKECGNNFEWKVKNPVENQSFWNESSSPQFFTILIEKNGCISQKNVSATNFISELKELSF